MALSEEFVAAHIAHWQAALTTPYWPHRKYWPTRLFHHAPLENALAILREGMLRSRNDGNNTHPRDVAAPGVIDNETAAHGHVRMYFRPKTPTQYPIEGIRKAGECKYGDKTHAPVLVMLALDAKAVLCRPDVRFSARNMQLSGTPTYDTEAAFSAIPFIKVFSEGGTGGDRSITDARCAEVLTNSPLPLADALLEIYFRSEPERDTVLHLLGADAAPWIGRCYVSDALKVFEKDYAFVQEVALTPRGVVFAFNARRDRKALAVKIEVFDSAGEKAVDFYNSALAARPPDGGKWIFAGELGADIYLVRIRIDDQLAYESRVPLGDVVF